MNSTASSTGVGIEKTRGWVDKRRKDDHTIHGTPNCSRLASNASSQSRAATWSGWSARCAGRTTLTSRSFIAPGLLSRLEELHQSTVRSQVKPRLRTATTAKYRHLKRPISIRLGELAAQCLLHKPAQRVATPPGCRLRRRQQLVVDRHRGAHVISIQSSHASHSVWEESRERSLVLAGPAGTDADAGHARPGPGSVSRRAPTGTKAFEIRAWV